MERLLKIWNAFLENPQHWFFYAFLLTAPFSIRKVLFFYPIKNSFNEYTGVYIYLSDIALVLTILVWLFSILYNRYLLLSNNNSLPESAEHCLTAIHDVPPAYRTGRRGTFLSRLFHTYPMQCSTWNIFTGVERFQFNNSLSLKNLIKLLFKNSTQVIHSKPITILSIFFILATLSINWSNNPNIALYKAIKLLEFILLFLFVTKNVPHGTFLKNILWITIFSGTMQAIVGIIQFLLQKSIGFLALRESFLSVKTPGVAKVILDQETYIRAYGLFPHPNIFGGFLVLSLFATYIYFKPFHACPVKCSMWNIFTGVERFTEKKYLLFNSLLLVQATALFLTFSKSAIISLFIGIFFIILNKKALDTNKRKKSRLEPLHAYFVKCSTPACPVGRWNIFTMVKYFKKNLSLKAILIALIFISLFILIKPDYYSLFLKSLEERAFYLNVPRGTISTNPLLGVGIGQSIFSLLNTPNIESWQFQPIHNVFLLILSELGIVGLILFIIFLYKTLQSNKTISRLPREMFHACLSGRQVEHFYWGGTVSKNSFLLNLHSKVLLISFIFIMLFDHYLWDIQQGEIMLWLVLGLISAKKE